MRLSSSLFLIPILSAFSMDVKAQNDSSVSTITLFETSGQVHIQCIINTGNTCNGIRFQRSYDSLGFVEIGDIPGICGSISEPLVYKFIDERPIKNKRIFYRAELGGSGYTEIKSIEIIDTKDKGYQVRPNPATSTATIYFDNQYNLDGELTLFSYSGNVILAERTRENYFLIDMTSIPSGLYGFIIKHVNGSILVANGRLIVKH